MIAALWSVCSALSLFAQPPVATQYTELIRAQVSCGMVITSFRPQTPAVLPTPPNVLEGFSKTRRYAPLSPRILLFPAADLGYL